MMIAATAQLGTTCPVGTTASREELDENLFAEAVAILFL